MIPFPYLCLSLYLLILSKDHMKIEIRDHLFWDVSKEKLDPEKNKKLIVERVLTRGNRDEVAGLLCFYGRDKIRDLIEELSDLDLRTLNFFRQLLH